MIIVLLLVLLKVKKIDLTFKKCQLKGSEETLMLLFVFIKNNIF